MAYNGYTEARKEANKRYMDTLKRVTLWLTPEEKELIEQTAKDEGKSVNQYIKDCIFGEPIEIK